MATVYDTWKTTDHEGAVCRGCSAELRGKPYWAGGNAYHPTTGEQVKVCTYGGYVCSSDCDRRASLQLEQTMPGHGGQTRLLSATAREISRRWGDA